MDINFYGALNVLKMMLPCVKSNGRIVNVSSVLCVPALKNCSKELQQEFESDKITEEDLCQLMNEFVTYAKSNTHEQRGFPTDAYGVSKIGVTVLTKMYGKIHFDWVRNDRLVNSCCPAWVHTELGGPNAPRSPEEGTDTPVYLSLLAPGLDALRGQFTCDREVRHRHTTV